MANEGTTEGTIAMLEKGIEEAEAKIRALRTAINTICVAQGQPVRYADEQLVAGMGGGRVTQIKDDTFYGKKQTPAMREYLEMRKAQNLGPAKPREIYDALKLGGFQFGAKDAEVALVSLRELLRTQPQIFHRLPQGAWGLTSWYPDAKPTPKEKKSAKKRSARAAPKASRKDQPSLKVVEPPKDDQEAA